MPELSVEVIGGNLGSLPEPWVLNETPVVDPAWCPLVAGAMCWRSWNRKPLKVKIHRPEKKNKMTRSNRADRATFFPSLEGFTLSVLDLTGIPLLGPM